MVDWRIDNNGTGETYSVFRDQVLAADVYDDTDGREIVDGMNELTGLRAELEALRKALEQAVTDLIGFLGYFERLGSLGTAQSIQRTLDHIDAALAGPAERRPADDGDGGA